MTAQPGYFEFRAGTSAQSEFEQLKESFDNLIDLELHAATPDEFDPARAAAFTAIHRYADAYGIPTDAEGLQLRRDFAVALNEDLKNNRNPMRSRLVVDPKVFVAANRHAIRDKEIPEDLVSVFNRAALRGVDLAYAEASERSYEGLASIDGDEPAEDTPVFTTEPTRAYHENESSKAPYTPGVFDLPTEAEVSARAAEQKYNGHQFSPIRGLKKFISSLRNKNSDVGEETSSANESNKVKREWNPKVKAAASAIGATAVAALLVIGVSHCSLGENSSPTETTVPGVDGETSTTMPDSTQSVESLITTTTIYQPPITAPQEVASPSPNQSDSEDFSDNLQSADQTVAAEGTQPEPVASSKQAIVVQKGDSLINILQEHLTGDSGKKADGDFALNNRIANALPHIARDNGMDLQDLDHIFSGQVIELESTTLDILNAIRPS